MKFLQNYIKTAIIVIIFFCAFKISNATHLLGGEISWECIKSGSSSGKFIFYMSLYRNCAGAGLANNAAISGPNGSIVVNLDTVILLNEACWDSNATIYCTGSTASKAIEHYIYKSAPITLSGTPTLSGWEFYWTNCCRPNTPIIDNLQPQNQSYRLTAKMYPYTPPGYQNPLTTDICYDSSPQFAQSPEGIVCMGINTNLNNSAFDAENDILKYSFIPAKQTIGSSVSYATSTNTAQAIPRANGGGFIVPAPVFSYDVPLPWAHVNLDTNNIPAVIDSTSGIISFTSYNKGRFAVATKVEAYKNGQLIAEISRDMPVVIEDCSSSVNQPPLLTLTDTSLADTIIARDTIHVGELYTLRIQSEDSNLNSISPLVYQMNTLNIYGSQVGSNMYNNAGCAFPPCAFIDSSQSTMNGNLIQGQTGINAVLKWQSSCAHLENASMTANGNYYKDYQFMFVVYDDQCPNPVPVYESLIITVLDTSEQAPPLTVLENTGDDLILSWTNNIVPFPGYFIYRDSGMQGSPVIIDSVVNVSTIFIDSGYGSDIDHYTYHLKKMVSPSCISTALFQSTSLNTSYLGNRSVLLDWNAHIPESNSTHIWYLIYSKHFGGSWVFEDSVQIGYDSLILLQQPCDEITYYKVEAHYSNGFISISNADSMLINSSKPTIIGNNGILTSSVAFSYIWLLNSQVIPGATAIQTTDSIIGYYQVEITDSHGCKVKSDSVLSINLQVSHMKANEIYLSWNDFDSTNIPVGSWYEIERKDTIGNWVKLDSMFFGSSDFLDSIVHCDTSITYRIKAIYSSGSVMYSNLDSLTIPTILPIISNAGTVLSSTLASHYQWFKDSLTIVGSNLQQHMATVNGKYMVGTLDSNMCYALSNIINLHWVGRKKIETPEIMIPYPNPTHGSITIDFPSGFLQGDLIHIWSSSGQLVDLIVCDRQSSQMKFQLKVNHNGQFIIELIRKGERLGSGKITVNKNVSN